jgi:hypothetical protein
LHHGELVGEPIDGGIIGACGPYEEVGIVHLGQSAQNLREIGLAELGCSARAGG